MSSIILTEEELKVYDLIQEYLKKKPFFLIEEVIDFVSYRLKSNQMFNRDRIKLILKELMKKKMIIPGTKLVKDNVLEVPLRVEIYDFITAMPGTNLAEIIEYHEIGHNQASWHLLWLEKFEFIRSNVIGTQKAFFKADFDKKYDEVFFYLRNSKVKQIIKLLKEQTKSINPTKISEKLNIHYNTVRKYLDVLQKFNLLKEIDENKRKEYLLNPDMVKTVQNIIDKLK